MKVSKELADVLRHASEEVASWPKWKKSLDPIGERSKPKCKYGDPGCPCQDGDECHYEGENPWPPPKPAESPDMVWVNRAEYNSLRECMIEAADEIQRLRAASPEPPQYLVRLLRDLQGHIAGELGERLDAVIDKFRATPSPEPPSNPICGICNMPLSDHEKLTKRCPVGHWDFAETVFTKSGQDIVKEAFDALTPERTEEILNEVEAKLGPDRASPEPPRQIADTLDDSLHEINIVGADPRNSIDHAISERTRRILAQQKPVPTIEEVVDALKSGDAFVVGHRDEKQDLSRQSPMYRDAAAILGEIGKSKFAHTQTLKLMNWKLEMAPSSHSEPELCSVCQFPKGEAHLGERGHMFYVHPAHLMPKPSDVIKELRESRTAWLEQHGVPVSMEFVRFANAIGAVCDVLAALASTPQNEQIAQFAERNTVDDDGSMCDAHGNHIPPGAAEEIKFWRGLSSTPEPPKLPQQEYKVDRLRNGKRMAEGAKVTAANEAEALEKAAHLFYPLQPGETFKVATPSSGEAK